MIVHTQAGPPSASGPANSVESSESVRILSIRHIRFGRQWATTATLRDEMPTRWPATLKRGLPRRFGQGPDRLDPPDRNLKWPEVAGTVLPLCRLGFANGAAAMAGRPRQGLSCWYWGVCRPA